MKTNKKGVSLIVLVLTIVIMIILGGVILLNLSNSGIIDKADNETSSTNMKEMKELASIGWAVSYGKGARTEQALWEGVIEYLESSGVTSDKLLNYRIKATTKGVEVISAADDTDSVVATIDEVPIPKGFTASPYGADKANGKAENTKEGGLVIYELKEGETKIPSKESYYTSVTTRNQYVWVPVDKDTFATTFVRKDWDNGNNIIDTKGNYYPLGMGTKYWEVTPDLELTTANLKYMTKDALDEVQKMYASVEKYGGFYVARYEAGLDESNIRSAGTTGIVKSLTNVHSKMNKTPYNYIGFSSSNALNVEEGGAVEVARSLYKEYNGNYGVVSTLIYGVQWDRILSWWLETSAVVSVTDSTTYGNNNSELAFDTFNEGAKYTTTYDSTTPTYTKVTAKKPSGVNWLLTTGATEEARVNNIYDMAGNVSERTMEGYSAVSRTSRGCDFSSVGSCPVSYRHNTYSPTWANYYGGFRPALYIK